MGESIIQSKSSLEFTVQIYTCPSDYDIPTIYISHALYLPSVLTVEAGDGWVTVPLCRIGSASAEMSTGTCSILDTILDTFKYK